MEGLRGGDCERGREGVRARGAREGEGGGRGGEGRRGGVDVRARGRLGGMEGLREWERM